VYQIENAGQVLRGDNALVATRRRLPRVSRNVVLLGLTSLFTDLSSEMVATILPLYLVFGLGMSPVQFGIVDGLYQGVAAFVRVASGVVADRWRRYKEVAALGYGLSAVCKLGFLAAGGAMTALTSVVVLERTGKGIRTAPRDALISLSSAKDRLATAFGVHRALDTAGAMLGPLAAFGLLALAPGSYDAVFVVSFCVALIGLAILVLFVRNHSPSRETDEGRRASLRTAVRLLGFRRFRLLVLVGAALALFTMSDGFIYLAVQRQLDFDARFLPLLYMATALVYMVLAIPIGRLADRVGRVRVFLAGYLLLLLVYLSLLVPPLGVSSLVVYVLLFGAYYAASEGVLMALASSVLPEAHRGSGLALLVTGTSLARLVAAIAFGGLWTWMGVNAAILVFALGLALALPLAGVAVARARGRPGYA
jgi:MFS family permease